MLRKAFPIDSHVEFEADGTPIYDRAITSAPLRKLIKSLVTDGVLPNPSTNMQVSAGSGMNVLVEAGFALCNGCMAMEESQRTLAVQASDTTYDRIDTVVLRLNDNDSERTCDLYVLQGVPASTPIRPTLTRTESIWEIGLADLFITPHSAEITNQRITDTRYETERCGVISAISEFDTTTLYNQVQADLVGFKEEEQAQFVEWFDYMKNQLSEDAAGNLQLQINDTNEKIGVLENLTTSVKDTIVGAINWLKDQLDALVKRVSKNETDISALNSKLETIEGVVAWNDSEFYMEIQQHMYIHNGWFHMCGAVKTRNGLNYQGYYTVTSNVKQFVNSNGYEFIEKNDAIGNGAINDVQVTTYIDDVTNELSFYINVNGVPQYYGIGYNIMVPLRKIAD